MTGAFLFYVFFMYIEGKNAYQSRNLDKQKERIKKTYENIMGVYMNPLIDFPADKPSGFLNTEPADGMFTGCDDILLSLLSSIRCFIISLSSYSSDRVTSTQIKSLFLFKKESL